MAPRLSPASLLRFLALILVAGLLFLQPLAAQTDGPPAPGEPTADLALRALRAALADPAARARLLDGLDRILAEGAVGTRAGPNGGAAGSGGAADKPQPAPSADAERPNEAPLVQSVAAQITRFLAAETSLLMQRAGELVETFSALPALLSWLQRQVQDSSSRAFWAEIAGGLLSAIGAGLIAGWLATLPTRRIRERLSCRQHVNLGERLLASLGDVLTRLLALAAFILVTLLVLSLLEPRWFVRGVTYAVIYAVSGFGIVMLGFRVLLRPNTPAIRFVRLSDATAADLWRRLIRIVFCGALIYFLMRSAAYWRLPPSVEVFLLAATGLVAVAFVARMILHYRSAVAVAIAPAGVEERGVLPSLRRRVAAGWHYGALVYVALVYSIWVLGVEQGFAYIAVSSLWSVVVLVSAVGLMVAARRLVREPEEQLAEDEDEEDGADAQPEPKGLIKPPSWAPVREIVNGFIIVLAVLGLMEAWGLGGLSWMGDEIGRQLGSTLLTLMVMVAGAAVALRVVGGLLKRSLAASEERGVPQEQLQRLKTIAPLVRNALFVVIVTIVLLVGLSELGVDITPLLAGAGVIGLAVGFGAQTLVKDVITGLFILIEDTVAVGDVAEIGGKSGVVESMTIRALRLRDLSGNVHTLPFSMVSSVTNYTKEYSYAVLDVAVSYREDAAGVMAVMEEVADRMIQEPTFGSDMMGPLEMFGLDRFEDNGMVIRARLQTRPGLQWAVRRAYNLRLKQRFDELGIEIPYPQRTLYMGEPREGLAAALRVTLDQGEGWTLPGGGGAPSGPSGAPADPEPTEATGTAGNPGAERAAAEQEKGGRAPASGKRSAGTGQGRSRSRSPKASRAGSSG